MDNSSLIANAPNIADIAQTIHTVHVILMVIFVLATVTNVALLLLLILTYLEHIDLNYKAVVRLSLTSSWLTLFIDTLFVIIQSSLAFATPGGTWQAKNTAILAVALLLSLALMVATPAILAVLLSAAKVSVGFDDSDEHVMWTMRWWHIVVLLGLQVMLAITMALSFNIYTGIGKTAAVWIPYLLFICLTMAWAIVVSIFCLAKRIVQRISHGKRLKSIMRRCYSRGAWSANYVGCETEEAQAISDAERRFSVD